MRNMRRRSFLKSSCTGRRSILWSRFTCGKTSWRTRDLNSSRWSRNLKWRKWILIDSITSSTTVNQILMPRRARKVEKKAIDLAIKASQIMSIQTTTLCRTINMMIITITINRTISKTHTWTFRLFRIYLQLLRCPNPTSSSNLTFQLRNQLWKRIFRPKFRFRLQKTRRPTSISLKKKWRSTKKRFNCAWTQSEKKEKKPSTSLKR